MANISFVFEFHISFHFAVVWNSSKFSIECGNKAENSLCKDPLIPPNRLFRNDININLRYQYGTSADTYIRVSICGIPQLSRYNHSKREITAESISELDAFLFELREIFGEGARKYWAGDMSLDLRSTDVTRGSLTQNGVHVK